jgi:hypothetical protein
MAQSCGCGFRLRTDAFLHDLAALLDAYEKHFVRVFDSVGFLSFFGLFVTATLGFATIHVLKQAKLLRLNP